METDEQRTFGGETCKMPLALPQYSDFLEKETLRWSRVKGMEVKWKNHGYHPFPRNSATPDVLQVHESNPGFPIVHNRLLLEKMKFEMLHDQKKIDDLRRIFADLPTDDVTIREEIPDVVCDSKIWGEIEEITALFGSRLSDMLDAVQGINLGTHTRSNALALASLVGAFRIADPNNNLHPRINQLVVQWNLAPLIDELVQSIELIKKSVISNPPQTESLANSVNLSSPQVEPME